jgi:hypothetical protein
MGKTTEFPTIADWLRQLDAYPNATVFGQTRKYTARDLATELRALLADRDAWVTERAVLRQECKDRAECEQSLARWNEELAADRDAWKEKAEDAERRLDDEKALRFEAQRPAARRLREYKGVTYREGGYCYLNGDATTPDAVTACRWWLGVSATDADHAALLALRDDPFVQVETLEDVVNEWCDDLMLLTPSLRADLCTRLRIWLAQQPAPTLTAAQHVAALVGMGAWTCDKARRFYVCPDNGEASYQRGGDILVLPPKATP